MANNKLIVIVGPTGIGKSSLAINLAKFFNTEIISADSRQLFKEITIGTGALTPEEQLNVKHHLMGSHSIENEYNAGFFERDALRILNRIFESNSVAIVCGGTGLYVNALLNGFHELPPANPALRKELEEKYKKLGIGFLQETYKAISGNFSGNIDMQNPIRLIRAIEVFSSKPNAYADDKPKVQRNFQPIIIGLNTDRELLYARINERVDELMQKKYDSKNWVYESVLTKKYRTHNALNTVGYKELFDYLDNKTSLAEAVNLIKQHTRNYAKKQITYFKKLENIEWFDPKDLKGILEHIERSFTA